MNSHSGPSTSTNTQRLSMKTNVLSDNEYFDSLEIGTFSSNKDFSDDLDDCFDENNLDEACNLLNEIK